MQKSGKYFAGFTQPILLVVFCLVWTTGLTLWPSPNQGMAVIFPPWAAGTPALLAAANAGADEVLSFGGWPSVVLVRSAAPDFIPRLYRAGALLVVRAPETTNCMRQERSP